MSDVDPAVVTGFEDTSGDVSSSPGPLDYLYNAWTGKLTNSQTSAIASQTASDVGAAGGSASDQYSASDEVWSFVNTQEGGTAESAIAQKGILGALADSPGGQDVIQAATIGGVSVGVILLLAAVVLFLARKDGL